MKKRIAYIVLAAMLIGAGLIYASENLQILRMVRYVRSTYPAATLQDVYKTSFQDYWGAEHMTPDSAAAAQYLHYELGIAAEDSMLMPEYEPCGWRHHYTRESLTCVLNGNDTEEGLLNAFLYASDHTYRLPLRKPWAWRIEWRRIERLSLKEVPEWHDAELETELRMAADSCFAVHHSPAFHDTYHPHYRITLTR